MPQKPVDASRYESAPNPAITPVATPEMTLVWRKDSRACGLERCTSMSGTPAVFSAAASRNA